MTHALKFSLQSHHDNLLQGIRHALANQTEQTFFGNQEVNEAKIKRFNLKLNKLIIKLNNLFSHVVKNK